MTDVNKTPEQVAADLAAAEASKKSTPTTDDAIKADRERAKAIMGCDEAKGREGLASHLALDTSMSVEEAKVMLSKAPAATAAAPAKKDNPFAAAMSGTDNPEVGTDGSDGAPPKASAAGSLLDSYVGTTGNRAVLRPGLQK